MISKKNISLTNFIVSQVSLFLLIMTLILGYISYVTFKNNTETLFNHHINYIIATQSVNAETFLWNYDMEGLEAIAGNTLNDDHILAVRILDNYSAMDNTALETGSKSSSTPNTLFENGNVLFPENKNDPNVFTQDILHFSQNHEPEKIGVFQVYVDYKQIGQEISLLMAKIAAIAAISYALLLSLIYATLKKSLKPLTHMSTQLESTQAENIKLERSPKAQTIEIETLFDAFEILQNKIFIHQQNLLASMRQAERANKIKDDFMANMSHELRTPLNSILGMIKILKEDAKRLTKEQKEMIGIVKKSADALLLLVNDILDISKIESGKVILERRAFNIKETVTDVAQRFMPITSEKGLNLFLEDEELQDIYVMGDSHRLDRILTNLCSNAAKYTDEGYVKIITSSKKLSSGKIELTCTVEDTGIGIPERKMEKIFDKFTQAEESIERRFGGTGLGLSITRHLLDLMNGDIDVHSEEGKGSTFTVTVPFEIATPEDIEKEKAEEEDIKDKPSTSLPKRGPFSNAKVLIAEDHELNQILIKKLITRMGCKNFTMAPNGKEAVKLFKKEKYDVVLMDYHMPEMNGNEATKIIREYEAKKKKKTSVIIIALTADAMVGTREKCIKAGMDDYLPKPIDDKLLRKTIEQWFELR